MAGSTAKKRYSAGQVVPVVIAALVVLGIFYVPGLLKKTVVPKYQRYHSMQKIKKHDVKVGDVLTFGEGDWENTWLVLEVDGSKVLLINEKCVDYLTYSGEYPATQGNGRWGMTYPYIAPETTFSPGNLWDTCGLKTWLNEYYYDWAFSDEEKAFITDLGEGSVFLLSAEEVERFFPDAKDRAAGGVRDRMPWWLRSSTRVEDGEYANQTFANYVGYHCNIGGLAPDDICYNGSVMGVRPVIWLDLDAEG